MPEIFSGLKVGAVQATIGAILAEWLSASQYGERYPRAARAAKMAEVLRACGITESEWF